MVDTIRMERKYNTMKQIRTAAIVGLGAIGGVVAPGLELALGHENLRVIAGRKRRGRLENGITINNKIWKCSVVAAKESTNPADFVIFAVKNAQVKQAVEDARNQIGSDTSVMSLLNGV